MLISVIIATYNSEKTLRQTLDSIRYQTYRDFEVIVIDGKSTDNTLGIVKEYSDIVKKYISEKDTGIYNAFNKGICLASGDYICFIGSDDCYCDYSVFDKVSKNIFDGVNILSAPILGVNEYTLKQHLLKNRLSNEEVFCGKMIPHPGLFVRRTIMARYMFNESNKIISDYEFLVRYLLDGGDIQFVDFPVVYFSEVGISSGEIGSKYWQKRLLEHMVLIEKLKLYDYLDSCINGLTEINRRNTLSYNFKMLNRSIRKKIGLNINFKKFSFNSKKHKCDLYLCRWCGRC